MLQMSSVLKQHRNSRTLVYKHCGRFWRSASQNMRVCVNWILMNTAHCFWSKTQYGWWTQSCTWNSSCHGIFSTLFPGISCNLPEQSPTSRPSSYRDPILVILEGDRSAPQKHGLKARFHVIVGFDEPWYHRSEGARVILSQLCFHGSPFLMLPGIFQAQNSVICMAGGRYSSVQMMGNAKTKSRIWNHPRSFKEIFRLGVNHHADGKTDPLLSLQSPLCNGPAIAKLTSQKEKIRCQNLIIC